MRSYTQLAAGIAFLLGASAAVFWIQRPQAALDRALRAGRFVTPEPSDMGILRAHPLDHGLASRAAPRLEERCDELMRRAHILTLDMEAADELSQIANWIADRDASPERQAEAAWARGNLELLREQTSEATLHFQAALRQKRDWAPALFGLGQACAVVDDTGCAVDYLRRAADSDIGWQSAWVALGEVHLRRRDLPQARSAFEAARQCDLDAPDPYFYLGEVSRMENPNSKLDPCRWYGGALERLGRRSSGIVDAEWTRRFVDQNCGAF